MFFLNVDPWMGQLKSAFQIVALLEENADPHQLETKIRRINGIEEAVYRTKEEELQYYCFQYLNQSEDFYALYEAENPMKNAYTITVGSQTEIAEAAASIQALDGVASVNYGGEKVIALFDVLNKARIFTIAILLAILLFNCGLIQNTIDQAIAIKKEEIFIMRTVGAKNSFIKIPFVLEGILIAVVGFLFSFALLCSGYLFFINHNSESLSNYNLTLIAPQSLFPVLFGFLLGLAVLIGFISADLSITRFIHQKR